ncbi:dysbindin protein homolog [Belonocnema kinseyi]|uniref:dysbindin protein homolog n=1 Tax=Belonocnema kinseyi TaxID=2817044 RepID=UPI00143D745C|nr:dysbindin protein homolog [Belonocnema kinseyi]
MFGTLRDKFHSVQEGISASIRGLTISESAKSKKPENIRNVNYNAGADILHRYQLQWNELHELAEENARNAQDVDSIVAAIHEKLEHEWKSIFCLNNTLSVIPKVNDTIKNLMNQIGTLHEMFEEVEHALFELEDLNEMLDLQNRQVDHRFQLTLYKENKVSELNSARAKLASEHSEKILKHELKQQRTLRERQATFEEAFKEELNQYKATGSIPKTSRSTEGPSLDEIVLETDSSDFDAFLRS